MQRTGSSLTSALQQLRGMQDTAVTPISQMRLLRAKESAQLGSAVGGAELRCAAYHSLCFYCLPLLHKLLRVQTCRRMGFLCRANSLRGAWWESSHIGSRVSTLGIT